MELVLATGNPGKVRELSALLADLGWMVRPQGDWQLADADETGLSFVENAILKARHAARHTGLPALADDSGLEVDALQGAPGVFSARYAGVGASDADNRDKLLVALRDVPDAERTARFWCVLAMLRHADDPTPLLCQASWEGRIATAPRGEGGFGYDPLFLVSDTNTTAAELPATEKNRLSHRAQALQQLRGRLLG